MQAPKFEEIVLQGVDANKFLQSQITLDTNKLSATSKLSATNKLSDDYQPAAIANLKGRIEFGIWIKKKDDETFGIITDSSTVPNLQAHINKYGAFSKITLSDPIEVYPCVTTDSNESIPTFSHSKLRHDVWEWMKQSIATGNYWITEATQGMFQPQELRLHQRGGVHYDKGCYLGQEVIARIYFKSSPKAFLHRVMGNGKTPEAGEKIGKVKVVNAIAMDSSVSQSAQFEALVVASPEQLVDDNLKPLALPEPLQASVARQ